MRHLENFFQVFTLLINLNVVMGDRPYIMDFLNVQKVFNPEFVEILDFELSDYNGHKALNGTLQLLKDVQQPFVNLLITVQKKSNVKPTKALDITINICQFIENAGGKKTTLPNIIFKQIQESFLNVPKKCPFLKAKPLYVNYLYLNVERFPPFLPDIVFNATVTLKEKNKFFLYNVSLTGFVKSKTM